MLAYPPAGRAFLGRAARVARAAAASALSSNAAATAIGITPQQLHTELAGKSLAQVAQAHGKTAAGRRDGAQERGSHPHRSGRYGWQGDRRSGKYPESAG